MGLPKKTMAARGQAGRSIGARTISDPRQYPQVEG
eukprot:SAG22_NODE_18210_length_291_cov_0.786458_1_plen_34_part_10